MPPLEAPGADIALLTTVGRVLEAGLEDLLRVGVGWELDYQVFIAGERVDELVLVLGGLHCGIWVCRFDIFNRFRTEIEVSMRRYVNINFFS